MSGLIFPVVLVFVLAVLARRFARQHESFDECHARTEEQYAKALDRLHKERASALPHEAMAPVVAGVREWLALYASPKACDVQIQGAVLRITLFGSEPKVEIFVSWVLRDMGFSALQKGRRLRKGHWEVQCGSGKTVCYEDLAQVMRGVTHHLREAGLVMLREPVIAGDDMPCLEEFPAVLHQK